MRYSSGERKKTDFKIVAPLNNIINVLPMMSINGGANIPGLPMDRRLKPVSIPKESDLIPIGSIMSATTSSSNVDYIPISTSEKTSISTQNYPKLENYLPTSYVNTSYFLGSSGEYYICNTPTKHILFRLNSTNIIVFDADSFPESPLTKTSPITINQRVVSAYGNGALSALEINSNRGIVSSDLNTFTSFTFPISGGNNKLIFNGTVFCVTTYSASVSYAYTSSNGSTYTQRKNFGNLGEMILSSSPSGLICAVQKTGTKAFVSSDNGINFIEYALPFSNTWNGLTWDVRNNQFVLLGNTYSCTSNTGTNWISFSHSGISVDNSIIASVNQGIFFFFEYNLWCGKTIPNYTYATHDNPIPITLFFSIDIVSGNNFLLHLKGISYTGLFLDKISFTENLDILPISAPYIGTQYFIRGK